MTDLKDKTIEELVNTLFSGQYYYNTDEWVELQSLLLSKMSKNNDFSVIATMIDSASKRDHFQVIEFICSHLNEKWCKILWDSIKLLIFSKSRDARYRGVRLHSFLAEGVGDYINIINCLNDEYQDVRLVAYHWMITHSDIVIDMIKKEKLPKTFSYFYQIYQETLNMDFAQLLSYSTQNHPSKYKKAIFFVAVNKKPSVDSLKKIIDALDDQDIFDYFHRYFLTDH